MSESLGTRIRRAMELRGIGYNELDRLMGTKGQMSNLIQRTMKPTHRTPAKTIDKLAVALGVNREWLEHGTGPIESGSPPAQVAPADPPVRERRVVYDDRYPNREVALAIYEPKAPTHVIKAVRSIAFKSDHDKTYLEWCKIIEDMIREYERVEAGEPVERTELDPSFLDLDIQAKKAPSCTLRRTYSNRHTPSQTWPKRFMMRGPWMTSGATSR